MNLKIRELYAFISTDENGDEGIIGAIMPGSGGTFMPFVGADLARVESLRSIADQIAKAYNRTYEIRYFKMEVNH